MLEVVAVMEVEVEEAVDAEAGVKSESCGQLLMPAPDIVQMAFCGPRLVIVHHECRIEAQSLGCPHCL